MTEVVVDMNDPVADESPGQSLPTAGNEEGDGRERGRRRGMRQRRRPAGERTLRRGRGQRWGAERSAAPSDDGSTMPVVDEMDSGGGAGTEVGAEGRQRSAEAILLDTDAVPFFARQAAIGLRPPGGRGGRKSAVSTAEAEKLHKILADAGIGSRRDMEDLIISGRVSVNGKPAHVGQRVSVTDVIRVNGKPLPRKRVVAQPQVLLYHKPTGELVTRDDPEERPKVFDRLPKLRGARWIAVGRLDLNSEGLLIFTTSGDLANRLMHPRYGWEREYAVRVLGRVDDEMRRQLLGGVQLEDGSAALQSIEDIGGDGANHWYRVVILEGRNREVRRLFEAVGLTVSRLVRIRFGPVALPPRLARGRFQSLTEDEVRQLQKQLRRAPAGTGTGVAGGAPPSGKGGAGKPTGGARHPTRRRLMRAARGTQEAQTGQPMEGVTEAAPPAATGGVDGAPPPMRRGRGARRKNTELTEGVSARNRRRPARRQAEDVGENAAPGKRAPARRTRTAERAPVTVPEVPRMVSVKVLEPTAEKRTLTLSERRGWTETRYLPQAVAYSGDTDWSKVVRESVLPDRRPKRKPKERNGNVAPRVRQQPTPASRRINYDDDDWQPSSDMAHMEGITKSMRRDGRQQRYGKAPGFAAKLGQPFDPNAGVAKPWPAQRMAGKAERMGRGKRSAMPGASARPRRKAVAKGR
ncbi:MAG: pseudouridine synthase [Lautropia sp.]|nr:pseudouridine synthase [Lautropia sp.]